MLKKFKSWLNENVESSIRKYFLFSLLDLSVGAVGMLVYGILTATYGPIWVRNQYFGLWLMTLIFFYSAESIYIELRTWKSKFNYINDLVFFVISVILPLLMCIFYGMAHKIDVTIWSIYIFSVNVTNVYILFSRRGSIQTASNSTGVDYQGTTEITNIPEENVKNLERNDFLTKRRVQREKNLNILIKILKVVNVGLRLFFLAVMCLLLNGAIVDGVGNVSLKARGKTLDVKLNDNSGRTIKINFLCDGPIDRTKRVFMFEGSGSHSLVDYLSLQKLLKQNNRRSCIWDKPGLGHSDYLLTDMTSFMVFYDNMIKAFNEVENSGFDFVGWGGGGNILYEYISRYPNSNAKSLTFLDTSPNNVEFTIPATLKKWTQSQLEQNKAADFANRKKMTMLINGLGVPWGLMSVFVPSSQSETFFSEFSDEIRWSFLTEKTWITQEFFLPVIKDEADVFQTLKINQTIPINIFLSKKSDQQVINKTCKDKKYDPNSADCKYEIEANKLSISIRSNLINLSQNGKLVECTMDVCDLGYFVAMGANYTVTNLLSILN